MPGFRSRSGQRIGCRGPRRLGRLCLVWVGCGAAALPAVFGSPPPKQPQTPPQLVATSVGKTEGHAQLQWGPGHAVDLGDSPPSGGVVVSAAPWVGLQTRDGSSADEVLFGAVRFEASASGLEYELQESSDGSFAEPLLRYRGGHERGFVSGLPEGEHYYRLRARPAEGEWSAWSPTLRIEILPHGLGLAWGLFAAGAWLVLCIVAFIVIADRRVRGEEEPHA